MSRQPANRVDARRRVYEQRSLEMAAEELTRYSDWVTSAVSPYLRGRTLEIGAGIGTVSARYVGLVDEAVLLEPATNLFEVLSRRLAGRPNVTAVNAFLDEVAGRSSDGVDFGDGSFDAVVMVNVLEHIEDDAGTLAAIRRLLRPTGALVVFVPALPFLYGPHDARVGHVRRYRRRDLARAVRAAGFRVERCRYFDLLGVASWLVHGRLLGNAEVGNGSARLYDRRIVPLCRAVDAVTGPFVGKNLVCVARPS